jgi:hypothetical protein
MALTRAPIDTTTAGGKLVFGIFAALAEFERDLFSERRKAGLASARARGRKGGRKPKMTKAKLRMAQAAMASRETNVSELCDELGVTRQTLYRHIGPDGALRADGERLLSGTRMVKAAEEGRANCPPSATYARKKSGRCSLPRREPSPSKLTRSIHKAF